MLKAELTLQVEESSLQMALTAVVEGAASHVETGTRRTCMQARPSLLMPGSPQCCFPHP